MKHSNSFSHTYKPSCPRPRDSSNALVKPGYRTQHMSDGDADSQPASPRVVKEPCGLSQGRGNTPLPASINRLLIPSSCEGSAAARTASPRLRSVDSRITKSSHEELKGRSKVWEPRSDSNESASMIESERGSDYAEQAWWTPEQVNRAERQTRARSTAELPDAPASETRTIGQAMISDSAEIFSPYIGQSKDTVPYSLDLGTTKATSPILGRGPQGKNKSFLKPRSQQPGLPTGTVPDGTSARPEKTGSGYPLPRPGTSAVFENSVEVTKAGGDSNIPTSRPP